MSAISSFFSSANAAYTVDTLFSTVKSADPSDTPSRAPATAPSATDARAETAGQRALSRIVEILTLGLPETINAPDVTEQLGYITSARGTATDDTLTMTGRALYNLDTDAGHDSLILKSGTISDIALGDGNDTLQAAGSFIGSVDGGAGDDTIKIKAQLALDVLGGAGKDSLSVSADTIVGLDGGDGDDTLNLEGNRIFATGGAGNDTVTLRQTGSDAVMEYAFGRGGGKDTIASNGPLSLRFDGLSEKDLTVSVSGNTLTARINGSDDAISVTLDGTSLTSRFVTENGQTVLKIG
jgi:Ca2+-binding RTX toxin-like protein